MAVDLSFMRKHAKEVKADYKKIRFYDAEPDPSPRRKIKMPVPDSIWVETDNLNDCGTTHKLNLDGQITGSMKRITKQYTVWKLWHEPKDIAVDIVYTLAIYGFVRLCMEIWSWL
jgi:hypothetical protein